MESAKSDLKKTVHLPRTDFPMKANLALREPELQAKLADVNLRVVGSSPAEFAKFLADEITKFAAVVKAANIKAE